MSFRKGSENKVGNIRNKNGIVSDALADGTGFFRLFKANQESKGAIKEQVVENQSLTSYDPLLYSPHRKFYMVLGVGLSTRMVATPYHFTHGLPKWVSSRYSVLGVGTCLRKTAIGLCFFQVPQPSLVKTSNVICLRTLHRRMAWFVRSSVDDNGLDPTPTNGTNGRTRLIRVIQDVRIKLTARIQALRKDFPMKILFFLVGFYCATAFATVIGQTGDWDILSAALAVVLVELIGALMYRASMHLFDNAKRLITMFNYWKAGLCLGLFLDSFKYEMDNILGSFNPFNFEIDDFPIFF